MKKNDLGYLIGTGFFFFYVQRRPFVRVFVVGPNKMVTHYICVVCFVRCRSSTLTAIEVTVLFVLYLKLRPKTKYGTFSTKIKSFGLPMSGNVLQKTQVFFQ